MNDTSSRTDAKTATDKTSSTPRPSRVESVLNGARGAANDALDGTRKAAQRAGQVAEANPFAVIAGGIAVGLAAGALLPKTQRETELLGPIGKRVTDAAADAAEAAKEAAKAELSTLPLSKEAARAQIGKVMDQVAKAVSDAGEAALASRSSSASDTKDSAPADQPAPMPSGKRGK